MAWTPHGMRRPRRRRADRRPPLPEPASSRALDRLAEPPAADPWLVLSREIDRCRRYRHPLALLRVVAGEPSGPTSLAARRRREGRPSRRHREPLAALVAAVRDCLRSGDVAWVHGPALFVLAPETDACGADALGCRVRAVAANLLGAPVDLEIAAFPEHGLTVQALRARLSGGRQRFRAPDVAPPVVNGVGRHPRMPVPRLADGPVPPELRERAD
jgi:hypothetical protein